MQKIAITGGICSGKTTVCKYLEELGYTVYYSDIIAIDMANTNPNLQNDIISEFGYKSFLDGKYNRKYIASIVFNDKSKLNKLNSIFKPYFNDNLIRLCEIDKSAKFIFYESALIFEYGREDEFDIIINIFADKETIMNRLKTRNNFTDKEISDRLNSQIDPLIKNNKSDVIIDTTSDWKEQVNNFLNV